MKLTFLGTKGYIQEKTARHRYHSSLLFEEKGYKLLVDHGTISKPLSIIKPHAILITHAHPDTFKWTVVDETFQGPIYVSRKTKFASRFQKRWKMLRPGKYLRLGPFRVLPYTVLHSIRAPALGFKITTSKTVIYNSDLIAIRDKKILAKVDLYIGDGSSYRSNLVRVRGKALVGHARMSTQLHWCQRYGIKKVIFTHLGKEPLRIGDWKLERLLSKKSFEVRIAHDNFVYRLAAKAANTRKNTV